MSFLYQLQNIVTVPEVLEVKPIEKKKRCMVVATDSFPIYEADIQTRLHESLINQWACPTFIDEGAQSLNHLPKLVFLFFKIFILLFIS